MHLLQPLPQGALDIVGDIHGEYEALCKLLAQLGYGLDGSHAEQRSLVFVGDFCDRGPDSPAVIRLIKKLVTAGRAVAVIGNHELNLLRSEPKDGAGWFFDERVASDSKKYAPFTRPNVTEREEIIEFLSSLPIALERDDLRVVHAAWVAQHVDATRMIPVKELLHHYRKWDSLAKQHAASLTDAKNAEIESWPHSLEDSEHQPPLLHAHADHDACHQMLNPIRVLTSGVERKGSASFFSSGKWRFVERVQWWQEYEDAIPVVVGHYWRRFQSIDRGSLDKGDPDLFAQTPPNYWHGKHANVFCVDFSVGGRWLARKDNSFSKEDFKLAALQCKRPANTP